MVGLDLDAGAAFLDGVAAMTACCCAILLNALFIAVVAVAVVVTVAVDGTRSEGHVISYPQFQGERQRQRR